LVGQIMYLSSTAIPVCVCVCVCVDGLAGGHRSPRNSLAIAGVEFYRLTTLQSPINSVKALNA